jgi:hypothetical protein
LEDARGSLIFLPGVKRALLPRILIEELCVHEDVQGVLVYQYICPCFGPASALGRQPNISTDYYDIMKSYQAVTFFLWASQQKVDRNILESEVLKVKLFVIRRYLPHICQSAESTFSSHNILK